MTSGSFKSVPVSSITINREARQRRELVGIDELAESIGRIGLIHPPVITREGILVAGERRLTAIQQLGWTDVAVQYVDELPLSELRTIELEENIKRVDIPWQDQCRAIEEYHTLRAAEDPTWTTVKTSTALGIAQQEVSDKLSVAKAITANPRVAEAPKYSVARGIVRRDNERKASSALSTLKELADAPRVDSPIITASFIDWAETYSGPGYNFIHCDFPYGIHMQASDQGGGDAHGTYDDDPDLFRSLLGTLCSCGDRITESTAHLMFWLSMKFYTETVERLTEAGWRVNPTPMIWMKSDNIGILPDPQRGPRNINEYCLIASRGDRKIVSPVSNGYYGPTERDIHMSIKPEPMLKHFFRMFVDEYSTVLDPTCGSGSAIRAAKSLGARTVTGLEINPEFADLARAKL